MKTKSILVKINGLYPGNGTLDELDPGTMVLVFTEDESGFNQLLLKRANSVGEVCGEIPIKYVGMKVKIRIRKAGFIFIESEIEIKPYGLFFTPKLISDWAYTSNSYEASIWDSEKNYIASKLLLDDEIRNFRHKNMFWNMAIYSIEISLIILGFFISPLWGVLIAIIEFLFNKFAAPYTMGLKKLF